MTPMTAETLKVSQEVFNKLETAYNELKANYDGFGVEYRLKRQAIVSQIKTSAYCVARRKQGREYSNAPVQKVYEPKTEA